MNAKQYYYMDRNGNLQCRIVEPPRRRHRIRVKSPVKLGGLLTALAAVGGAMALLLGGEPAPVSQLARVEVAAAPLSAAMGDEGVSAEDIGEALWADFVDPTPEPAEAAVGDAATQTVALPGEAAAAEAAPEEAAPAVEAVAVSEDEARPAVAVSAPAEKPVEEPAVETVEETAEEPVEESVVEPVEETAEEPAEEVAAEAAQDGSEPGEDPTEAAPVTAVKVPAAASNNAEAMEVPVDERIAVQTIAAPASGEDAVERED